MSKINSLPKGLQELLGNTSQGKNPDELSNVVYGNFDILPFWGIDKTIAQVVSANTVHVVGQGIDMNVPEGEAWYLKAASGSSFLATTESGRLSLHISNPAGTVRVTIGQSAYITAKLLTEEIVAPAIMPSGFILPSGWSLRSQWEGVDAGLANTMSLDAIFYRIRV